MFDNHPDPAFTGSNDSSDEKLDWEVISIYTREDAIVDGVLVPYQFTYQRKKYSACFSRGLHEKYKKSPSALKWIAQRAMKLLAYPDPQDTESRKLRVILDGQIWAIEDADGLTFLRPEDVRRVGTD